MIYKLIFLIGLVLFFTLPFLKKQVIIPQKKLTLREYCEVLPNSEMTDEKCFPKLVKYSTLVSQPSLLKGKLIGVEGCLCVYDEGDFGILYKDGLNMNIINYDAIIALFKFDIKSEFIKNDFLNTCPYVRVYGWVASDGYFRVNRFEESVVDVTKIDFYGKMICNEK